MKEHIYEFYLEFDDDEYDVFYTETIEDFAKELQRLGERGSHVTRIGIKRGDIDLMENIESCMAEGDEESADEFVQILDQYKEERGIKDQVVSITIWDGGNTTDYSTDLREKIARTKRILSRCRADGEECRVIPFKRAA